MTALTATANQTYGAVSVVLDWTATGVTGLSKMVVLDTFNNRTVSSGWGSPEQETENAVGQSWNFSAGITADYNVVSGVGTISIPVVNTSRRMRIGDVNTPILTDSDIYTDIRTSVLASGDRIEQALLSRYQDANNYYQGSCQMKTDQSINVQLYKKIAGTDTLIANAAVAGLTHQVNVFIRIRLLTIGTRLLFKAYNPALAEPQAWAIDTNDSQFTGFGGIGVRTNLSSLWTGALPMVSQYDNFSTWDVNQPVYVWRVTPDGVKTLVRGAPVKQSGGTAVLWDDEVPVNTVVSYVASMALDGSGSVSSNSVTITGTGGDVGWLKDPLQPGLDIQLNFMARAQPDCVGATGVVFSGFESNTYVDADGEFPIIDNARPVVVSMTRKTATGSLALTTLAQSDIVALGNILASGRPLLLQLPTTYGWAYTKYGSDYIHIRDVTEGRFPTQDMRHPQRLWTLPFALCTTPANSPIDLTGSNGIGVGHATYDAMKASGLTYTQLNATGMTYQQLAQGLGY